MKNILWSLMVVPVLVCCCMAQHDAEWEEKLKAAFDALPAQVQELINKEQPLGRVYNSSEIKLNDNYKSLLVEYSSPGCGNAGCDEEIYIDQDGKWRLLVKVFGGVEAMKNSTDGWKDFAVYDHLGGGIAGREIYRWNMRTKAYESVQHDTLVNGTPKPEVFSQAGEFVTRIQKGEMVDVPDKLFEDLRAVLFVPSSEDALPLQNYTRLALFLNKTDEIKKTGEYGNTLFPETGIFQLALARSYASEEKPLYARLAAERGLQLDGLTHEEKKELEVIISQVKAGAAEVEAKLRMRPVAAKLEKIGKGCALTVYKPVENGHFELAMSCAGKLTSMQVLPGFGFYEDIRIADAMELSSSTLLTGPVKYDIATFTFRMEKTSPKKRQDEVQLLYAVDKVEQRPFRVWDVSQTYVESPYLLLRREWRIISWPQDPPAPPDLIQTYAHYDEKPGNRVEIGCDKQVYNNSQLKYLYVERQNGKDCPIEFPPEKPLW